MRTPVLVFAGLVVAALVLALGAIWLFQRRLIYFPFGSVAGPATAVLPGAEDVVLVTEDGLELAAWFLPARGAAPAPTMLAFHGNAGSRLERAAIAEGLARRGVSVLLVEYRGYGGNPGTPSERGLLRDARAARTWVDARTEVDPARIVYFGESLGAAVAVALAGERPPAALVLRSPFTSLVDVARFHYSVLPVRLLLRERYPSIDTIRRLDCPLLVIAGTGDRIVPFEQSRRLLEAAGSRDPRWLEIDGADHNDAALVAGARVLEEVAQFIRSSTEEAR